MIRFLYNLALVAALILGAPWWLWRMATTPKYRQGLLDRLGRVPRRLQRFQSCTPEPPSAGDFAGARPAIWLHAVSVGEVLAASRLVGEIDRAFPEFRLLISTTTQTGQELARQRFGAERVFYCPLDLPWALNAYLSKLQPRLLILAETEFWPNLLSGCFRRGIPVAVVNARISDRSWPRYLRLRRLWRPFLGHLARVLAQSQTDADRLRALGCAPERVAVAGNLKFDVRAAQESEPTRLLRAQATGLRFLVAGSTLENEEAALLEIWPRLLDADAGLVLILAPRHPERFAAVAALLEKSGFAWARRSELLSPTAQSAAGSVTGHELSRAGTSSRKTQEAFTSKGLGPGQIVLLDTIGELAGVYSLAAVAFVGGSIVPAGGHNPLEPAQFAVPIVMGPHYANFRAIVEDLLAHQALRIAGQETLAATIIELLCDGNAAQAMGERAKQVFERQAGATARCLEALRELLAAQPAAERIA